MPVKNRIQLRRGTSTQWSNNVILASGELGWDINLNNIKIGDGSNLWDDLPWLVVAGVSGQIINPAIISGVSGIFFDTSVGDVDQIAGQLGWNNEAGTFDVGLTDDLKISVGQSVLFRVKNSTGSTITKGEAVYASGVLGNGQIIQVAPFVADETIPEVRFIGLMLDDLANGEDGFVAEFGHIKNVDLRTTNTVLNPNGETWAVGDILFVDDASAGGLTKVQPKNDIYVAMVLADGSNGELFVRITNPGHINDLHDVNTSGLVDNNLLVWNSGTDVFEPSSGLYYVDGELGIGTDSPNSTLHVYSATSGDNVFNVEGTQGSLFGVTDSLSGTLMSVNTIAGLPVLEVNSDYSVTAGRFNQNDFNITAGGDIGIGIAAPSGKLHVVGDSYFNHTLYIHSTGGVATPYTYNKIYAHPTYDHLILQGGGNTISLEGQGGSIRLDASTTFIDIGNSANYGTANQYIRFTPANTERMRLTHEGKLGIGTSDPQTLLDVSGVITATGGNSDEWNETYDWIQNSGVDGSGAANHIAYWSDSNSITYDSGELYWDSNNNRLGIGTSSPSGDLNIHNINSNSFGQIVLSTDVLSSKLHVSVGNSDTRPFLASTHAGTGGDLPSSIYGWGFFDRGTNGDLQIKRKGGTTSWADVLTIARTNGDVGIGTASPSYKLDVAGSGNFTGNLIVGGDLTVNGTTVIANVDTMEVEDPILTLGLASGNVVTDTNLDRGLALALNSNTTGFMGWDTSAGSFVLLSSGVTADSGGTYTGGTYGDLQLNRVYGSGDNTYLALNLLGQNRIDISSDTYAGSTFSVGTQQTFLNSASTYLNGTFSFPKTGTATSTSTQKNSNSITLFNSMWDGSAELQTNIQLISYASTTVNERSRFAILTANEDGTNNKVERLSIVSNGRVGIGTENPVSKLHTTSAGGPNVFTMENDTYSQSNRIDFITPTAFGPDSTGVIDCSWSGQGLTFKTPRDLASRTQGGFVWYSAAGDAQMVLRTHYGDLGVGTDNPQYRVHVSGGPLGIESTFYAPNIGTGEDNSVLILDSDGFVKTDEIDSRVWGSGLVDGAGTANYVSKWSDADTLTNSIIYDNGSNVGIGTTSPSYKLQVQDADMALIHSAGTSNGIRFGDSSVRMRIGREATTHDLILESLNGGVDESIRIDYGDGNVTINEAGANIDFRVEGDTDTHLLFADASTSRVGIGTDSPDYKLDVLGGIRSSGNLYVANQGNNVSGIINFQNLYSTSYYQTAYIASETLANYGSKLSIVAKRSAGGTGAAKNIITTINDDPTGYPNQNTHVTFNSDDVSVNAVIYIGHGSNSGVIQSGNSRDSLYTERGAIFAATTGNVGIGLTNPTEKLDVSGNANISGHLSAATKSFLIDHPTKEGKKLQYGSLESPYHGVRLTGRDKLKEGFCVIKLPPYMNKLVREEDISIQITNYKHHKTLYVDDIDLSKNQIIIKGHRCKTLGELEFFWSFTAIRKDVPELVVEK